MEKWKGKSMYIRWKIKPRTEQVKLTRRTRQTKIHAMLHCAYLAECTRVDGKPRQTAIYLASIQDRQIESTFYRWLFWRSAQSKIEALNLTAEQIAMMKGKLRERVPELTPEEIAEQERKSEKRQALYYYK